MLLIQSPMDVAIVGNPFCEICFEKKMNTKILNQYPINPREYVNLMKIGVEKGFNVRCICNETLRIKDGNGEKGENIENDKRENKNILSKDKSPEILLAEKVLEIHGIFDSDKYFDHSVNDPIKDSIKDRYKKWIVDNHPDRGGNEDTCKSVISAYNIVFCEK
jgi:hypothetical protein